MSPASTNAATVWGQCTYMLQQRVALQVAKVGHGHGTRAIGLLLRNELKRLLLQLFTVRQDVELTFQEKEALVMVELGQLNQGRKE